MSHERSETIERPSGAYNVYGGTQYPLNPIFGFEHSRYDSIPQAVNAAQWRSHMGGGPEGGQSPVYGFQPQPQPEYIGFLKQVLAGLMDPRTQAMLTPGMGLMKAPQAAWNATRVMPNLTSERGNWNPFGWLARPNSMDPRPELNMNVPLSHMREQMAGVPSTREFVDHVSDVNRLGKILDYGDDAVRMTPESRAAYMKQIEGVNPQLGRDVESAAQGMRKLQAEDMRMYGRAGQEGAPPPEMMQRLFGY